MGLFEHWPYVNFHDLNLDWIIKEIPKVYTSRDEAQASAEASAESAAASQLSADASLASQEAAHQSELNAAQSEENAAESEANAKNYADNIAEPVSGLVTSWLTDHITNPSNPPIDTSLTVAGAAADAKKTGDELANIRTEIENILETDALQNVSIHEGYSISTQYNGIFPVTGFHIYEYDIKPAENYIINATGASVLRYGCTSSTQTIEDGLNILPLIEYSSDPTKTEYKNKTGYLKLYVAVNDTATVSVKKQNVLETYNYVTPEMFGAIGDGVTNDYSALQRCINYATANGKPIFAYGTYLTDTVLIITGTNVCIKGNATILYTGSSDFAIRMHGVTNSNFEMNAIKAENASGIYFYCEDANDWNQYIVLDIKEIYALRTCIYVDKRANQGWTNEVKIYNTHFASPTMAGSIGLYISAENGSDGWRLFGTAFENIDIGVKAVSGSNNIPVIFELISPRVNESFNTIAETSNHVIFQMLTASAVRLDSFNLSNNSVVTINGIIYDNNAFYSKAFYKNGSFTVS